MRLKFSVDRKSKIFDRENIALQRSESAVVDPPTLTLALLWKPMQWSQKKFFAIFWVQIHNGSDFYLRKDISLHISHFVERYMVL